MIGVYSIAELVDDSNKRPTKTIFYLLHDDDHTCFNEAQWQSLQSVKCMVRDNGAYVTELLENVAALVNSI